MTVEERTRPRDDPSEASSEDAATGQLSRSGIRFAARGSTIGDARPAFRGCDTDIRRRTTPLYGTRTRRIKPSEEYTDAATC